MRKVMNGLDNSFDTWQRNLVSGPKSETALCQKEAEGDGRNTGLQDKTPPVIFYSSIIYVIG